MMLRKVAVLLLVLAIISPHPPKVSGNCTLEHKRVITVFCSSYIYSPKPGGAPETWSRCCRKVREVMAVTNMECIVQLLSPKDQKLYGKRIRDLELVCAAYSPPPSHRVMAQRDEPVIPDGV
ncbi:unnamed protein product [Urochloa decumbens]|uniref:Bifunctional inhibitor/plant lipid transfer protein/seed storage helical domain-containing protein n=1 Tax=Urochloa decumbens TaxID=240449 RepID=A0ABC9B7F5_9POAL